LKRWCCI